VARRLGEVDLGLHAHPRYLKQRGIPGSLDELDAHQLIGFDHETAFIREVQARGFPLRREMFSLRTDSDLAQLATLRAGCGIGVCQVPLAARSGLTRVLPKAFAFTLPVWLAMHGDLRASRRCRLVFDALAEGLTGYLETAPQTARAAA
jgi:DNA-binding transcriptional LysR family regulator